MSQSHLPSSWLIEGNSTIQAPEEVQTMLLLASKGWGIKRIARELGCSKNTVKRYLKQGGWKPYAGQNRKPVLSEMKEWLQQKFHQHEGNADVVRQDLEKHGVAVSLRTVERAVAGYRRDTKVEATATLRFETVPAQQLQIDFGSKTVLIANEPKRIYMFVATLGYSRRLYAEAFFHERQSAWFQGLEGAFRHFGGVTSEVLVDNAQALVKRHNRQTGELVFNERFMAFAKFWGFSPRACAPYRPRTKGKDERGVGYVKRNALAGHEFASDEQLATHIAQWLREVADARTHGTTGESPKERFDRDERDALTPLGGKSTFLQVRELFREVANDAFIDVDTNRYSVPWRLIGERVSVNVEEASLQVHYAGRLVATHALCQGRFGIARQADHFSGIYRTRPEPTTPEATSSRPGLGGDLLRPLSEYEAIAGGAW